MRTLIAVIFMAMTAGPLSAGQDFTFENIEGGEIHLSDYHGGPVLVVNTASRCGFTYQYDGMQALYDAYKDKGLTVLAVPSDAFNQELASNEAVAEFCEVNYNLTVPMTEKTVIKGADAHPFYEWLRASHRFTPSWNFNKVLLDENGDLVATYGSNDKPMGPLIEGRVKKLLAR